MTGSDCLGCGSECQLPHGVCITLKGIKAELDEALAESESEQ